MIKIREEFCKLKGWSFIDFEDHVETQEYALFLESKIDEKQKEIMMLEKAISEIRGDENKTNKGAF